MVLGIWSKTDNFFCHFWLFFALLPLNNLENWNFEKMKKVPLDIIILHMCDINENHIVYGSWDMEKKKKKPPPRDIINLHKCTINDNHMMYCSWDMKCNQQNFLSFWAIFSPFTPLTAKKIKILKKCKKHLEISSFYTNVPRIMIIYYSIPEIWHITDVIIFHFWGIFCPFTSLTAQKIKI